MGSLNMFLAKSSQATVFSYLITSVIRQFDCYSTSSIMLSMFLQSSMCTYHCICFSFSINKKGSPVHVAPTCAGSGDDSDHLGLFVRSLSLHLCKRLVPGLDPMTSRSQGSSFTTALRLPFSGDLVDWIKLV